MRSSELRSDEGASSVTNTLLLLLHSSLGSFSLIADWVCPHVIGGIPLDIVTKTFPMTRDGKCYTGITGLTTTN